MRKIAAIVFNDFETLDVFGPIEVLGRLKEHFDLNLYSLDGGIIRSVHKVQVVTKAFAELPSEKYVLFIPGGAGVVNL